MVSVRVCCEELRRICWLVDQLHLHGTLEVAKEMLHCLPMSWTRVGAQEECCWSQVTEIIVLRELLDEVVNGLLRLGSKSHIVHNNRHNDAQVVPGIEVDAAV